ncbi:MAG: SCO family protein [Candidatus Hydrogenedentes bacterium]|nr:SCO family protein [Candidatus Hydrogenedentota bacterium]
MSQHGPHKHRPHFAVSGILAVLTALACFCIATPARAQEVPGEQVDAVKLDPIAFRGPKPSDRFNEIKIDQKLDAQVPLDLPFLDEAGNAVKLSDYFQPGKPVILTLVYYECPMLCTLVLNDLLVAMGAEEMGLEIGKDYEVVTISINPNEVSGLGAAKKAEYLAKLKREGGEQGWHFLTGAEDDIQTVAASVGFRYYYDADIKQYAHASGIMILTPEGKVSSYYLGLGYLPHNVRLSLVDAASGKIGSLADQLVLLCYDYDPASGAYGFYIMSAIRLAGGATVMAIVAFWIVMYLGSRKKAIGDGVDTASNVIS